MQNPTSLIQACLPAGLDKAMPLENLESNSGHSSQKINESKMCKLLETFVKNDENTTTRVGMLAFFRPAASTCRPCLCWQCRPAGLFQTCVRRRHGLIQAATPHVFENSLGFLKEC